MNQNRNGLKLLHSIFVWFKCSSIEAFLRILKKSTYRKKDAEDYFDDLLPCERAPRSSLNKKNRMRLGYNTEKVPWLE